MKNILIKNLSILSFFLTGLYAVVGPHGEIEGTASSSFHNNNDCVYCHIPSYEGESIVETMSTDGGSMICMSCHDGVNAMNMAIGGSNIGNILDASHPVSIEYIEGRASLRLKTDTVTGIKGAKTVNDLLVNGKVECISCHDQHGTKDTNGNPLRLYLRNANTGSALCYACHNK